MKIPGRVGYQCSNFYRQLIREGVIIDDNYYVDKNNQLTFRFKSRMEQDKQEDTPKRKRKQLRSAKRDDDEEIDPELDLDLDLDLDLVGDEEMGLKVKSEQGHKTNYYEIDDENCLPVREFVVECSRLGIY